MEEDKSEEDQTSELFCINKVSIWELSYIINFWR